MTRRPLETARPPVSSGSAAHLSAPRCVPSKAGPYPAQELSMTLRSRFLCAHSKNMYLSHPVHPAEHQRIGAFELWCWRRLLRAPWTSRRSNQSNLKEINPEYSSEGLTLKLQYFGHLIRRVNSLEKTLMQEEKETTEDETVGWHQQLNGH